LLHFRHPTVDTDVQTCLLKISEVLFKPSDESVPVRIPEEKQPVVEAPVPVATKIRIHAPSVPPIEPSQSPGLFLSSPGSHSVPRVLKFNPFVSFLLFLFSAPLPKIILKDHPQHLANDTDLGGSSPPRLPPPDVPSKLAAALIRKPKPPPKPKKFQASGMTIPDHKMCQNLLKKLASNPLSQPFRKPVDPIRESAPN
jgi:transcription initiation factor TFIID subunit 2